MILSLLRPCSSAFIAALAALFVSSCQSVPPVPEMGAAPPAPLYQWQGDGLTGRVAIRIDLSEQKAYVSRGGVPAGWSYVAAGTPSHPTPPGSFSIIEKVQDKHSNAWGVIVDAAGNVVINDAKNGRDPVPPGGRFVGAPMPYWMRIRGAIGMHAGHIPEPGSPASHGCIRFPEEMAAILFSISPLGTPVQVVW